MLPQGWKKNELRKIRIGDEGVLLNWNEDCLLPHGWKMKRGGGVRSLGIPNGWRDNKTEDADVSLYWKKDSLLPLGWEI